METYVSETSPAIGHFVSRRSSNPRQVPRRETRRAGQDGQVSQRQCPFIIEVPQTHYRRGSEETTWDGLEPRARYVLLLFA